MRQHLCRLSTPMLERLPFEIAEQIAVPALLDDGRTACALAATSHLLRRAFAPWRYHSVALRGPHQIRAFLALLERSQRPARLSCRRSQDHDVTELGTPDIRLRHLFLSDCRMQPDDPLAPLAWADWQVKPLHGRVTGAIKDALAKVFVQDLGFRDTTYEAWERNSAGALRTIRTLLEHVAGTLTHLHLNIWMALPMIVVPNVVFPALIELTSSYRNNYISSSDAGLPETDHARILPVLRRLHIVANTRHADDHFLAMSQLPPSLTHLRLSEGVEPLWLLHTMSQRAATTPRWLPSTLRIIVIAPHAPGAESPSCTAHPTFQWASTPLTRFQSSLVPVRDEFQRHWTGWRWAASHKFKLRDKVFMVREHSLWDEDRLLTDWLDRTQGSTACWVDGMSLEMFECS
jgi:hypothetical protein